MEYFFRYAGQLSEGDEVLIQKYLELKPEKVLTITDVNMRGRNHS